MSKADTAKSLAKKVEKEAKKHPILIIVMKSKRTRAGLTKFANELSKELKGKVVRSGYTPNSDLSLYEMRRKGLVAVLLVIKSDEDCLVAIDRTTDGEIAEIESNVYSSNINDVYVRLVSDIF